MVTLQSRDHRRPATAGPVTGSWLAMRELVLDNERRREVSEALGIGFGRVKPLLRLADGPLSMRELASYLGIDAPYTTVVVDDLERRGLVERRAHPQDRRAKLVVLTPAGRRAARRALDILEAPPSELTELPREDLVALERIMRGVRLRRDVSRSARQRRI